MAWHVSLEDQDPEGFMPVHWWSVHLAFDERPELSKPGGTWTLSAPGEHWARILETGLAGLTEEQIYSLVDQYN